MNTQTHLGKLAACAVALVLSGSAFLLHRGYNADRKMLAEWNSLTNTIPQMIALGNAGEAHDLYENTWEKINAYSKELRHQLFTPITMNDLDGLEKTLNWRVLDKRTPFYATPGFTNSSLK